MENIRAALLRDVEACRELLKIHDAMAACGYQANPYWENYALVADGIYKLIGEEVDDFTSSVTYLVLNAPYLTNERRVEMLMNEYRRNFPEQPKPNTCTKEEFFNLYNKNGGYMHETPEGDWE